MKRLIALAVFAASTAFASIPAQAQEGLLLGQLSCNVAGGAGFIFGSSKELACTFTPADSAREVETYNGTINKFGVDIGFTGETRMIWTVVAAEADRYAPGALTGRYVGGTAQAAFAAGLGANVLVGGVENSFALQPLSISATTGVNVAVGIAEVRLSQ